jgi:hypothetical protein
MGAPAPQPFDQLGALLQALYHRQIPPLPAPSYAYPAPPAYAAPAPQNDPMAMLRTIVGNPQFQQALQWSSLVGQQIPRQLQLPIPAPGYPGDVRSVSIPMGAVMGTVASLAASSRNRMGATTREDESEVPEYLIDEEGDFIVDPASSDDRAALVAHLFLLSDEAQRSGWFAQPESYSETEGDFDKEDEGMDETEEFALDAGFKR